MAAQYTFSSDMTLHENMVCRGLCVLDQDVCGYIYDGKVNPVISEKAMTCVVNPTARENLRRIHGIDLPDCPIYIAHKKGIAKACKGLLPKGRGSHTAWSKVAAAAVEKCRDFTGQSLVVLEKQSESKNKNDISGSKTRVLFAMAQITDKATIAALKKCHADLHELKFGMSKETQRMDGDHSTHMTGKPFIQTNTSAMTYGYATYLLDGFGPQLTEGRVHAAIEALAAMVWRLAVERFPFLDRFREQALGQLVQQLAVLGATATNIIAGSTNAPICLHFDKEDGPMSIILWLHSGLKGEKGGILDGHFVVPGIFVRLVPTDVTIVVISTADLLHGTFQLMTWGGAIRYGTSHFLRIKDARMVVNLERGVGHVREEVVRSMAAAVRDGRLAPEQAVTQTLEAGPTPQPMTPLLSSKLQTIFYHNMHCNTLTEEQRESLGSYFLELRKTVMERGAGTWNCEVVDTTKLEQLRWQTYDAPARGKRSLEGLNRKHAKRQQKAAEREAAAAAAGSAAKQSK